MRALRALGLASLLAGVLLIAYAATTGDVRVGLLLIVPFVYGTGLAPFLGTMLVMAGLVMLSMSAFQRLGAPPPGWTAEEPIDAERRDAGASPGAHRSVKHGGVVLLGPIPIVWGSDRRILPWMVGAGVVLLVLALLLTAGRR